MEIRMSTCFADAVEKASQTEKRGEKIRLEKPFDGFYIVFEKTEAERFFEYTNTKGDTVYLVYESICGMKCELSPILQKKLEMMKNLENRLK